MRFNTVLLIVLGVTVSRWLPGILAQTAPAGPQASILTPNTQPPPATQGQKSALEDLDKLGQSLLQQSLPLEQTAPAR